MARIGHVRNEGEWTNRVAHALLRLAGSQEEAELGRFLIDLPGHASPPEACGFVTGVHLLVGDHNDHMLRALTPDLLITEGTPHSVIKALVLVKPGGGMGRSPAGCPEGRHFGDSLDLVCLADGCGLPAAAKGVPLIYLAPREYLDESAMWTDFDVDQSYLDMVSDMWPWIEDLVAAIPRWTTIALEDVAELLESLGTGRAAASARTIRNAVSQLEWKEVADPTSHWED